MLFFAAFLFGWFLVLFQLKKIPEEVIKSFVVVAFAGTMGQFLIFLGAPEKWMGNLILLGFVYCIFVCRSVQFGISGIGGIMLGALLNNVVVFMNGKMPVAETAENIAAKGFGQSYMQINNETILPILGDWIKSPTGEIVSIGDLLVLAGIYIIAFQGMRRKGSV